MEEVYTCSCDNQTWTILDFKIRCTNTECQKEYKRIPGVVSANYFNNNREEFEITVE